MDHFANLFEALTNNPPFPWQASLYKRFIAGDFPSGCDLPTGLGKTSVIAVWLIALAEKPDQLPRRLAYVVNRRTVVDQTTDEIEKLRRNLLNCAALTALKTKLAALSDITRAAAALTGADESVGDGIPLAISTLRGQFADNRQWSANPACPAVIVGTVDMIGSRLLFGGYGAGFKTRPLYAGLLGQDALLVHDEAHLEPAFQELIESICEEQEREPAMLGKKFRLKVMELSATPRGEGRTLQLGDSDVAHPVVRKRIESKKQIYLVPNADAKKVADAMAELVLKRFGQSNQAILIFVRKVEDVEKIAKKLPKEQTAQLTGTLRGLERDALAQKNDVFARFVPGPATEPRTGTVYLISTSAGEVGVNLSADHMVSDLSNFDSMAQRLGRVNRFGEVADTEVHIFHPAEFEEKDERDIRLAKTLRLLQDLNGDASPRALSRLDLTARREAFALPPTILPVDDILFDAWSMTSIRETLPGRPKLDHFLHGLRDQDQPETHVAWREEVGTITGELLSQLKPDNLLEDYPLKPQELLRDRSDRVYRHLAELAKKHPDHSVWLVDEAGNVQWLVNANAPLTLAALINVLPKEAISYRTVLLSPLSGGLRDGLLDGASGSATDVADELFDDNNRRRRIRVWRNSDEVDQRTSGMRLIRDIGLPAEKGGDENDVGRSWCWFEWPAGGDTDGSKAAADPIPWDDHTNDVERNALRFVETLAMPVELKRAVVLAARLHDLGKKRETWQRSIGNPEPTKWLAKSGSGRGWLSREVTAYRHEFGSLLDMRDNRELAGETPEMRELVLHLVAAHHGYARPHFPGACAIDAERPSQEAHDMGCQVPQRFARLQRKYGRWGLAYLESLLRAADYEASAHPTKTKGVQ